jgi:16S rRNA (adenine1518-N6/adenine1519-N6)-dimethyltransferase
LKKETANKIADEHSAVTSANDVRRSTMTPVAAPVPCRSLGQNFLVDKQIIARVIESLKLRQGETIIEIGPGQGALTAPLLEYAGRLVAVEFDRNLIPFLEHRFSSKNNLTLIQSDALLVEFCQLILPSKQARIVANLPYNIATAILQRLIKQRYCLPEITLILQKEMVDRIIAPPGSKHRGYISVLVQAYYEAEKLFDIAPHSSRPAPNVASSVVRLTRTPEVSPALDNEELLSQILSAGFAQRRKTILNNLRKSPLPLREKLTEHGGDTFILSRAAIDYQKRAEMLTLTEWVRIADQLC